MRGGMDWTQLAQDRSRWRAIVNMTKKSSTLIKTREIPWSAELLSAFRYKLFSMDLGDSVQSLEALAVALFHAGI
jgi:hypothetical protein